MHLSDEFFMREALREAEKAFQLGEVPVGAVLVSQGGIIARGHNQVESLRDASAHAEMVCVKKASAHVANWRLLDTTLYSTLEPCAMCAGALILSRVGTLVWGAKDLRHGAHGSWVNLFDLSHPIHRLDVRSGVLQEEAAALMISFFRKRREDV